MGKDIYNLELHESYLTDFGIVIMRVPGGWMYDCWDTEKDNFKIGLFVPFNNEFQDKAKTLGELFPPEPKPKFNFKKSLIELGVTEQVASDWLKVRSKKGAANTKTAFEALSNQIKLTNAKPDDCIKLAVVKNWTGFKADWYFKEINETTNTQNEQPKKLQSKF